MLGIPKFISGYSGSWVNVIGYANFFCITALMVIPCFTINHYGLLKVAPIKN